MSALQRHTLCWLEKMCIRDRFCMLHSGLMILEANLNYRIGSSFDTITKDLLGKEMCIRDRL